jgi:signal transduction histidine kinase
VRTSPLALDLLRVVGTGVLITGPGGEVITANDEFAAVFADPADVPAELWRAGTGRRRRSRLPGDRMIEGVWHELTGDDGAPLRALVVRDLTGGTEVRRRLRQHNRALAELVATKTELVSALLHEVRTPLAAARSPAEMLPMDEALRAVLRNLDRIADVTGEIATVSGIENGTVDLDRRPLDLPALLIDVALGWGDTVTAIPAEGLVFGDAKRLAEVFDRLIAAVHAIGGGAVEVRVSQAAGEWRVALPLPPDTPADQLFTATGARSNATALMLARAVVGRHDGTVGVETDETGPALPVRLPAPPPGSAGPAVRTA